MPRGLAIVLLGALSACTMLASFDGLEGRSEPEPGDGAAPPPDVADAAEERDARADAEAPRDGGDSGLDCGDGSLGAVFCDDFSGPLPSSRWTSAHVGGGGELTVVPGSGEVDSPFLRAKAPVAADGGAATAYVRKRFDVAARDSIDLSLRLRADAVSPSSDATWTVVLEWPDRRLLSSLHTASGLNVQERIPTGENFDYVPHVYGAVIPPATWVTYRVRVERVGLDARALVSVNGAPVGDPIALARTPTPLFPATIALHVGIYYAANRAAEQVIAVDDVRIELR